MIYLKVGMYNDILFGFIRSQDLVIFFYICRKKTANIMFLLILQLGINLV